MKIIPVILSGGSGTRLWPLSSEQKPKQYLSLVNDNTMLQETILRLKGLDNFLSPIIVCNVNHRFLVAEQCREINVKNPTILLEPVARNTAPAILAAAFIALEKLSDAVLLILAADHIIEGDSLVFHQAIKTANKQALLDKLVTFGVEPTDANTGYGYIKPAKEFKNGAYKIESFVEKPNLKNAKLYFEQNSHLWNSGMFMFKATNVVNEMQNYAKDTVKFIKDSVKNASLDLDFIRLEEKSFALSKSNSIDYELMEKSQNSVVVPLKVKWNDVGSWKSLYDIGKKDNNKNVIKGNVIIENTNNTYINSNDHVIAAVGVKDLIVVATSNATLILTKDNAQKVKNIVKKIKDSKMDERRYNSKFYRPWGWYDCISEGENFQVKILHVNPKAKLSLQMHKKRTEYWVVVKGVATIINGEDLITLKKGQTSKIPIGVKHSIQNNTNKPLEIVEVQSGTYLGEDDIIRFEDIYGRDKIK